MTTKALAAERAAPVTDIARARAAGAPAVWGRDGERLVEWLSEVFLLHSDDRPVVIFLRHVTPNRRLGDKLGTIQLKALAPDQRNAEAAPEMAHMVWAKAENYASGLGGAAQQFAAQAYYEDDPSESETSCFFWIKVATGATERGVDSLPADEHGVLQLLMGKLDRFEDNFCDLMAGSVTMMQCMREQIRDLHEQALADRRERRENEEAVRTAKEAAADREAQRESAKASRETQRELVSTVKTVGLAVARRWGGLDVRDAVSPGAQQLLTAFESLARDEKRFMAVLSTLSESERANFMEWWQGQIELMEKLKGEQAAATTAQVAPAPVVIAPPAAPPQQQQQPASPSQPKTPAEQAALARVQAQQWAAVATALEADAALQAQPTASAAVPAELTAPADAAPAAVPPEATAPAKPSKRKKKGDVPQ